LFSGTAPITYSNGLIGISQATTSTNGYLSSTDWNTFNNKISSVDTTNISNFSVKVRSLFSGTAPITYSNGLIGISQSTTSTNGYLSSADWNSFNTKGSGSVTSVSVTTANGVSGVVATPTTTPAITLTLGAITPTSVAATGTVSGSNLSGTNTGNVTIGTANGLSITAGQVLSMALANTSTIGALSNTDWNTFNSKLSSVDTTNISNFSVKVRSLFSGTSPITYSNGLIGISQSTTSTNGYLSSTDWNTFNNKLSSIDTTSISNFSAKVRSLFSGTAPITYSNGLIGISQATTSTNGYLSSTDWNTFNNKISSVDTTNISNFSVKVRSLFSGTAPITYSNGLIGISQSTTSTNGYLSSADWNSFNTKGSGSVTSVSVTTANGVSGVVATPTTTPAITLTLGAITPTSVAATGTVSGSNLSGTNTGNVTIGTANGLSITAGQVLSMALANTSTTGVLSNTDWNTFNNKLSSIDTTNISNFSTKVRSLFSGTAPITYTNGLIGISQATTSTNGYLNSTDWNTFNNKANGSNYLPLTGGTLSGSLNISATNPLKLFGVQDGILSDSILTITGGTVRKLAFSALTSSLSATGPITYSNGVIGITQATTSANGYLSSTDWNTFNNKAGNSNVWLLGGNSGITPVTNFIGTIDNKSLRFRTNNIERLYIDSLTGSVGIDTSGFTSANPEKLLVNAGTSSVNAIVGKGTINNYLQLNIQNLSNGANASSDVVATADNGSETTNYVDMGINSSANTSGSMGGADDAYFYNIGNNLLMGTGTASKSLIFMTGGTTQSTNERMRIDGNGNVGINTNSPNSTLEVVGSAGFSITTTTSNLTLNATHHTVIVTGLTPTITLPAASSCARRVYIIVNETGSNLNLSGSYIGFNAGGSTIVSPTSSITIQSNGTSWYRIQ